MQQRQRPQRLPKHAAQQEATLRNQSPPTLPLLLALIHPPIPPPSPSLPLLTPLPLPLPLPQMSLLSTWQTRLPFVSSSPSPLPCPAPAPPLCDPHVHQLGRCLYWTAWLTLSLSNRSTAARMSLSSSSSSSSSSITLPPLHRNHCTGPTNTTRLESL